MKKLDIVIVEDEILVAEDLCGILERLGHIIVGFAKTGEEALNEITEKRPDLIFMDVKLQGKMTGLEIAQRLKASQINIPVIFASGFRGLSAAIQVTKPFASHDIHAAIQRLFNDSRG